MKLFVFEHCPYCVRAMMLVGFKGLKVEKEILQNDDVDARVAMVGANMVPILQKADGSFMGESLDIVAYLDAIDGKLVLSDAEHEEVIKAWQGSVSFYANRLIYPRTVRLGLPEYATQAAIDFYIEKKSALIEMSFDDALAHSADYIANLEPLLSHLEFIALPSERDDSLGYDDILLFPTLRNLTMVAGLEFPHRVRRYIDEVARLTHVRLFDDAAL
ncbi:glutaredoxin 2 [Shewanella sedimentimangrovi]|uniref:Glutaredoxin 2 n=1 Tax=Shewanella sedimentimangrovi TaxID=2814293 RepID=A0ABX7R090_9GAMM|nr:glutaredoxin 2 [Shewanella sedimentimangrovi]QSX36293.1 glutaredoxin 2 [Shewanella sedimentimangrovi]